MIDHHETTKYLRGLLGESVPPQLVRKIHIKSLALERSLNVSRETAVMQAALMLIERDRGLLITERWRMSDTLHEALYLQS